MLSTRPCQSPLYSAELWFADEGSTHEAQAVELCFACPARIECAAQGLSEEYGVWGGTTPNNPDRKRGVRQAKRAAVAAERAAVRADVIAFTAGGLTKAEIAARLGIGETLVATIRRTAA